MNARIRRLLREPILHFLLIGGALFALHDRVVAPSGGATHIVVSAAMIDRLEREHEARWTRKPGNLELAGLVDGYVRDEILYREGLALGLDRDDALIKRRVRQKFEVIAEEQGDSRAPSEADLAAYMAEHSGRFLKPATLSFEQVFFDTAGPAADFERTVAAARAAAKRGVDPEKLGQTSMLATRVEHTARDRVVRDFGAEFAQKIDEAPLEQWVGPIRSSFGAHLVRVGARTPAVLPELDEIRRHVAREWENERRASARNAGYQKLRERYTVVIETKDRPALAAQR